MRITTSTLILLSLLGGCQAPPPQPPKAQTAPPPERSAPASTPAASAVIEGSATYRERIKMPPGADVVVELHAANQRGAAIASVRLDDIAGPPFAFRLPYDPRHLKSPRAELQARLIDPNGETWMQGVLPVTLPATAPVELLLKRAADPPPQTDNATKELRDPWAAAHARGIVYRAVGNEPGWYAEVGAGDLPLLRATLDYGERIVEVPRSVGLSSTRGYGGKTADGARVMLRIYPEACSDGMSDMAYPTRAELRVGGQVYSGCGRYLRD